MLQVCEASFKEAGFDYIVTEKMVCAGGEKGEQQIRQIQQKHKYKKKYKHNTLSQRTWFVQALEKAGQFLEISKRWKYFQIVSWNMVYGDVKGVGEIASRHLVQILIR